jgi:hypothetical protein
MRVKKYQEKKKEISGKVVIGIDSGKERHQVVKYASNSYFYLIF